jgi:hypothetical protein
MRVGLLQRYSVRCDRLAAIGARFKTLTVLAALLFATMLGAGSIPAREPHPTDSASSRETQADAIRRIPIQQLNRDAQAAVSDVIDKPSFFRRMPTEAIDCDPQMFQHLVRYPEVLVNVWDVMGITKVQVNRTGPYTFTADDGVGTTCKCDLVFGSDKIHIYYGTGAYKGSMAPRQITGRCVCVLYSNTTQSATNRPMITGTMDVFLKLDNLGADLLTRTLSPLVGKTADYNFVESAKFLSQISQVCERNPAGAQILASKLTKIKPEIRDEFARIAHRIGSDAANPTDLPQLASIGPDGSKLTSKVIRDSNFPPRAIQGKNSDPIAVDATQQLSDEFNPQRVAPMTLSDTSYTAESPAGSLPAPARSAPIAPAKPNIYMRR